MRKLLLLFTLCLCSWGGWASTPTKTTSTTSGGKSVLTINSDDAADYDTWKSANLSTINGYDKIVYVGNYSSFSALEDDITVPVIDVTDAILAGGSGMEQGGVKTLTNSNIKCVIYASGGNYQQITGITPDATLTEYVLIDTNTSTATALFNNSVTFWSNTIEAAATHFDKLVMTGSLANSDAITVASGFDGKTLNMENLTTTSAFTFANADIKRVILPDYWDKTAVRAAAEAIINGDGNIGGNSRFEAALSQHGPMHNYGKDNPNEPATLIAYVQQPGTLYAAVDEILPGGNKMGKKNAGAYYDMKLVKYVSIMGYPSARDFSNGALTFYTADGHFRFNEEADETSNTADTGVSGNTRTLTGSYTLDGALNGVEGLISLDLGDAIIYDQWCEDITFGYNNVLGDGTKEVIFPTCSELTIIPADCLSGGGLNSLEEICIPGNIRTIKTRAFNSSAQALCHIWTTGTDPDVKYDNGAYLLSDQSTVDHYDHAPLNSTTWNCKASFNSETTGGVPRYGTITLPPNLELIESNAFSCEHVSDVYVLTATAPECHVDAFSSVMYLGNNTINSQSKVTADGMVTRDAYCVNPNNGTFISMLHYPVETTTPDLQRYTDPTREYHVATTLRDDNGNIIYFPNQSELNRAYWQGTTGYLWNAWNPERVPNGNNENSFVHEMGNISQWRHTTGYQTAANTLWEENPGTTVDKTDRSFYDVRLGTGEQPVLAQPTGLDWYYNTVWEEQYLYPKIDYTDGSTVVTQIQETDQQGNPVYYEDTNNEGCNYVEDYSYEQDNNGSLVENITVDTNGDKVRVYTWTENPSSGAYVLVTTVSGYEGTTTPVAGVSSYYTDNTGATAATPKVGNGFYYVSGSHSVYTQVDTNDDSTIGTQAPYYTENNGTYTESGLRFNYNYSYQALYYPTGATEQKNICQSTTSPVPGVTTYYSDDEGTTAVTPTLNSTYYYNPVTVQQTSYVATDRPVSGVTTYYSSNDGTDIVVVPTLATSYYGNSCRTFYYDSNNDKVYVTTYDPSITTYYAEYQYNVEECTNYLQFASTVYYKTTEEVTTYSSTTDWQGDITYYVLEWRSNVYDYYETTPTFSSACYYITGTQEVPVYASSEYYIPGQTWYYYDSNNKTYTSVTLHWYNFPDTYYYVSGSAPDYSSASGLDYDDSETYYTDTNGTEASSITFDQAYYYPVYSSSYITYTGSETGDRYDKVYASTLRDYDATTDAGETRYTVGTGYRAYDSSIDDPDSWLQRYKKDYNGTYREYDASIDDAGETRYCPSMVDVYNMVKSDTHDYRGWHQFVLTAYSNNSHETTTTVRFYQTDNDWWTVCLPYDLKHSEMVKFFGKESTGAIPYLSKLQYVVRDYDKGKITLMFSNNLMEYKEVVDTDNDQVHGTIDNSTRYTTEELEADPVILHAGVPYLIRPNIDVNASRSFTVAQEDNADLYNRLHNAQSLDATALNTLIYHGEYTVPAYVVGANTEEETTNSKTIANKDGFSQTYTPGDITYGGQTVTAEVSSAYTYTFVGTFFISRLPQYCYFLGWVGPYETGHAAFWYNRVTTDDYNWNNQTGIICPNFDTNLTIYAATSVADPARWIIGASDIGNDDLLGEVGGGNSANSTSAMDFGGSLPGQATGIKEVSTQTTAKADRGVVYNTNGQVVRTDGDLQGLTKGVYIVNGKKYVVK